MISLTPSPVDWSCHEKMRCPYFELNGKTLHNPDNAKSDEWTAPARTELSDRIATVTGGLQQVARRAAGVI